MVSEASGWFARVDHECNDRVKQIEIWLDAWEKSVIRNIPVAAALPKNWPILPAGLLSEPGTVLDTLLSRFEAEEDGRSVRGIGSIQIKLVDLILADEFKNTNIIKNKEPLATISISALPPGFRAYAEQMNNDVQTKSKMDRFNEETNNQTRSGIPIPFADLSVGAGIFPDRMLKIHSERCNDLRSSLQKEDTIRLLEGLQLVDASEIAVYATKRRLLITLMKLNLVSLNDEEGKISKLDAKLILENNVLCRDILIEDWPWNEKPTFIVSKPPWLRIKDKFRNKENGSELRKRMSEDLRNKSESNGKLRYSALRGNVNLYRLYVERALQIVQKNGKLRMVVPDSLLREKSSSPLRKILVSKNRWETCWSFSEKSHKLFPGHSQGVLVIGITAGGRTEVLTSFGPLEIGDFSNKEGLNSKAPFLELERGLWSTWTDASWAVPRIPRDSLERKRALTAINNLADEPRLGEKNNWLNQGGKKIRVRPGEIVQSNDNVSDWEDEKEYVPLIRSGHLKLKDDDVVLSHPAIDNNMSEDSPDRVQSIWKGEIKIKDKPRIICQTIINSELGRRLLWSVLPKNYALANSMNYLQIPEETRKMLIEEFGDLENALNIIVKYLNSDNLNIWSNVWAANSNVNNYEIFDLPFPKLVNTSSLPFNGNKSKI
tara:strand:- start:12241 stop:14220 length:1980 start_codon:yes stop_codon:yes gene_type:complete